MSMDFSEMLEELARFQKMKRVGWNGKDQYVFMLPGGVLQQAVNGYLHTENEVVDQIWIKTSSGKFGPYTASNCDMLASDWEPYTSPLKQTEPALAIRKTGASA